MTYTDHQQEECLRQMTLKWSRMNVVTRPFLVVLATGLFVLRGVLLRLAPDHSTGGVQPLSVSSLSTSDRERQRWNRRRRSVMQALFFRSF